MFSFEWRWRKRKKRKGGTRYEHPEQKPRNWSTEALKQEKEKGGNARQKNKLIKTITDDEGAIRESSGGKTYCGRRPQGEHQHLLARATLTEAAAKSQEASTAEKTPEGWETWSRSSKQSWKNKQKNIHNTERWGGHGRSGSLGLRRGRPTHRNYNKI